MRRCAVLISVVVLAVVTGAGVAGAASAPDDGTAPTTLSASDAPSVPEISAPVPLATVDAAPATEATGTAPTGTATTAHATATGSPALFTPESAPIPGVLTDTAAGAVATGADGSIYYSLAPIVGSSQTSSQIGRVDATWAFSTATVDNANVIDMASGPGAGIWFTNAAASPSIGHLVFDPAAGAIVDLFPVPALQPPFGITMGGDGNLWTTVALGASPQIGRMTPTGTYTAFPPLPSAVAGPTGIVTGLDGSTFWADGGFNGVGSIGRTNLSGISTVFPVAPLVGPGNPTIGPFGDIWFTSSSCTSCSPAQSTNRIGRMTPTGDLTGNFFVSNAVAANFGTTLGPDGNVWFSQGSLSSDPGANAIGRITPDGVVTLVNVAGSPGALAADRKGYIWWTSFNTDTDTWEMARMLVARADLSLTKTVKSAGFGRGDEIVFDLVATNNGPTDAGNVAVMDTLPDGLVFVGVTDAALWRCEADGAGRVVTCSLGRLANGESSGFSLITRLVQALAPGADLVNTATISSSAPDPDPSNNTAVARVVNSVPESPRGERTPPTGAELPRTGTSPQALVLVGFGLLAVGCLTRLLARRPVSA